MALKFVVDSLEGVPETLSSEYVKDDNDGKFYLQVDGAVSKKKLDEFRENNVLLLKKLEPYKDIDIARYNATKDVDVNEYTKLKTDALTGAKLTQEDVNKMVNERVATMKSTFDADLQAAKNELVISNKQLNTLLVDSTVRQAAALNGVKGSAVDDVVLRANNTFKVEGGIAVPYDARGNVIYGSNGDSPMSVNDWVKSLKPNAEHLFEPSTGGGSRGSNTGGQKSTAHMTPLQKIQQGIS